MSEQLDLLPEPRTVGKAERAQLVAAEWHRAMVACRDAGLRWPAFLCQQEARDAATTARRLYTAWGAG